jgi:hypothetical protein
MKVRVFADTDLAAVYAIQLKCPQAAQWRRGDYLQMAGDPGGTILVAEMETRSGPDPVDPDSSMLIISAPNLNSQDAQDKPGGAVPGGLTGRFGRRGWNARPKAGRKSLREQAFWSINAGQGGSQTGNFGLNGNSGLL